MINQIINPIVLIKLKLIEAKQITSFAFTFLAKFFHDLRFSITLIKIKISRKKKMVNVIIPKIGTKNIQIIIKNAAVQSSILKADLVRIVDITTTNIVIASIIRLATREELIDSNNLLVLFPQ